MALPQYAGKAELHVERMWYTGSVALVEGESMAYAVNADPDNTAFASLPIGAAVTQMGASKQLFCGVVDGGSSGSTGGWITVIRPRMYDVITIAVAVGIDSGDGAVITASQAHCEIGGVGYTIATDEWIALYDEDNANNPHGTSAISASVGLVEALYIGPLKA